MPHPPFREALLIYLPYSLGLVVMGEPEGKKYDSKANALFPSREYLKRFTDPTADPMMVHVQFLEGWHRFYSKYVNGASDSKCLLEFGGGPTLHSLITACRHVESITFADYAESNRNEIIMWKEKNGKGKCVYILLLQDVMEI